MTVYDCLDASYLKKVEVVMDPRNDKSKENVTILRRGFQHPVGEEEAEIQEERSQDEQMRAAAQAAVKQGCYDGIDTGETA
jgi:hypothetical protein